MRYILKYNPNEQIAEINMVNLTDKELITGCELLIDSGADIGIVENLAPSSNPSSDNYVPIVINTDKIERLAFINVQPPSSSVTDDATTDTESFSVSSSDSESSPSVQSTSSGKLTANTIQKTMTHLMKNGPSRTPLKWMASVLCLTTSMTLPQT